METAKIFKSGNSRAVRLSKKFDIEGDEVYIKKVGDTIVLVPKKSGWKNLIVSLDMFSDDFMETREQLPLQDREEL